MPFQQQLASFRSKSNNSSKASKRYEHCEMDMVYGKNMAAGAVTSGVDHDAQEEKKHKKKKKKNKDRDGKSKGKKDSKRDKMHIKVDSEQRSSSHLDEVCSATLSDYFDAHCI